MENDNIKKDENLQEESFVEETSTTDTEEKTVEVEDAVAEDIAETEIEAEDVIEEAEADEEEAEDTEQEAVEEASANGEYVIQLTEEDIAKMEALKKKERNRNLIIAAALAVVIAIIAFFVCYTQGVGGKNIVNGTGFREDTEASFWSKLKGDNIKYENPVVTAFDKVTGKNKEAAMKVNGAVVNKDVLSFVTNSSGLDCVYSLVQLGEITDVSNFDWNKVDADVGISYIELSKGMAVETLIPIYATIAEGEKRGIVFTDEDDKTIKDWIAEQKQNYGADFEKVLKDSGYADENTLYEIQKIQIYMQKVYEDIESNPSNYITDSIKNKILDTDDEKVTVKHILIGFEQGEDGSISDEAKANAKKTAEEVLAKVKAGDDFDALVEQYNTDPGATDKGYTFAQDGSMVKEFEDASFALEVGETSELVETTYGYHIIKRIERSVTADDYISYLIETVPVNINKSVYDNMQITIDLNNYFGTPEEAETSTEE